VATEQEARFLSPTRSSFRNSVWRRLRPLPVSSITTSSEVDRAVNQKSLLAVAENRASGKRCEMDKARSVSGGNRESNISKY